MFEGLEKVSSLITRYAIFEHLYLTEPQTNTKNELRRVLIVVYLAILRYLLQAQQYYSKKSSSKLFRTLAALHRLLFVSAAAT